MKTGGNFETSMVRPLGILVYLVKRQIRKGSSKSGIFFGRSPMSHFLAISFSLEVETQPKRWGIIWEIFCSDRLQRVGTKIFLFIWGLTLTILILRCSNCFSLEGWSPRTTLTVKIIKMFKRFRCNLLKNNIKFEGTQWCDFGRVTWTIINWYHRTNNGTVRKTA